MDQTPHPLPEEIAAWPRYWENRTRLPSVKLYRRANANLWEWGDPSDGYTAILHGDRIN